MSSQITRAQLSDIHYLAHVLDTRLVIFSSCAYFTVYQPHHVTSHHYPGQVRLLDRRRAV